MITAQGIIVRSATGAFATLEITRKDSDDHVTTSARQSGFEVCFYHPTVAELRAIAAECTRFADELEGMQRLDIVPGETAEQHNARVCLELEDA